MSPDAVPFTVLGGYLGAGKTTILNSLLRRAGGRRLGVLVNDFGDVSIDAEILRSTNDGVVELAGGCVCCDLSLGMGPALTTLLARSPQPEQILVEVSGVGEPAAVAAWGHTPGLRPDAVVVAVALDRIQALAADRWVGDLVTAQLAQADLLACTRGDTLSHVEASAVAAWLREHTAAPQVAATQGGLPVEVAFDTSRVPTLTPARPTDGGAGDRGHGDHDRAADPHPPISGASLSQPGSEQGRPAGDRVCASTWSNGSTVDPVQLREQLAQLTGLLRAKGFVQTDSPEHPRLLVQAVGRTVELTPWTPDGDGSVLSLLTTPDLADADVAAALPAWHRLDR